MFRVTCWCIFSLLVACGIAVLRMSSRHDACHTTDHGAKELIAIGYPCAALLSISLLTTLYTSLSSMHMRARVDIAAWMLALLCGILCLQAVQMTLLASGSSLHDPCVSVVSATAETMGRLTLAALLTTVFLLYSWKRSSAIQKLYSASSGG